MTITAVPTQPEGDLPAMTAQEEAEFNERHAIRGSEIKLSDATSVLDSILSVAVSHDTVCQYAESRMYKQLGLDGDDSRLNDYLYSAVTLCAILAPAAMRRVPAPVYAKAIARSGEIESLNGDELDAFMRPIFEEAGIGERFEVRTGYQVYRDPEAARSN